MFYTPKYFSIKEFVPEKVFKEFGDKSIWFVRPEILVTADRIRERYNKPMVVNTWPFQENGFQNRGFRDPDCIYGAKRSLHKLACAIDFNVEDIPSEEIQKDIIKHPFQKSFELITCVEIEPGVEKTHVDIRAHNKQKYGLLVLKKV